MRLKAFCLLFIFSSMLYAQNKSKIIPIVNYNPVNYESHLQSILQFPQDYLEITNTGKKIVLYVNQGKDKSKISKGKVFYYKIPNEIIERTDSVFFLQFQSSQKYEFKYYGVIKNDIVSYYKYNDEKAYSLYDLILSEYGSIDKFKRLLIEYYITSFNVGRNNGLYSLNNESAIKFLKDDYVLYELYKPSNKSKIIQLFIDFLKKHIAISEDQVKAIEEYLQKGHPALPLKVSGLLYYNPNHNIKLMNDNYTFIMAINLPEEQYEKLITQIEIQEFIRTKYVNFIVKNNLEINHRNGARIYLTDEERAKGVAELIFNQGD